MPPIESPAIFVIVYKGNKILHTIFYEASVNEKKAKNVFPTEPKTAKYLEGKTLFKLKKLENLRHGVSLTHKSSNTFFAHRKSGRGKNQDTEKGQVLMRKKQCL